MRGSIYVTPEYQLILGRNSQVRFDGHSQRRNLQVGNEGVRIHEVTIFPEEEVFVPTEGDAIHIILPIEGKIRLEGFIKMEVGEIAAKYLPDEFKLKVRNPFLESSVHFLDIVIQTPNFVNNTIASFDTEEVGRGICRILNFNHEFNKPPISFYLGQLKGRLNEQHISKGPMLCYVLSGAFEVQERLMEKGDALWVSQRAKIDVECLSAEGIVLMLELPL